MNRTSCCCSDLGKSTVVNSWLGCWIRLIICVFAWPRWFVQTGHLSSVFLLISWLFPPQQYTMIWAKERVAWNIWALQVLFGYFNFSLCCNGNDDFVKLKKLCLEFYSEALFSHCIVLVWAPAIDCHHSIVWPQWPHWKPPLHCSWMLTSYHSISGNWFLTIAIIFPASVSAQNSHHHHRFCQKKSLSWQIQAIKPEKYWMRTSRSAVAFLMPLHCAN